MSIDSLRPRQNLLIASVKILKMKSFLTKALIKMIIFLYILLIHYLKVCKSIWLEEVLIIEIRICNREGRLLKSTLITWNLTNLRICYQWRMFKVRKEAIKEQGKSLQQKEMKQEMWSINLGTNHWPIDLRDKNWVKLTSSMTREVFLKEERRDFMSSTNRFWKSETKVLAANVNSSLYQHWILKKKSSLTKTKLLTLKICWVLQRRLMQLVNTP